MKNEFLKNNEQTSLMKIREIFCKSLLNKSAICDYCINPYVGCQHGCLYCYAEYYTKKYTAHEEPWGSFVDIKINAPQILKKEILKKKHGSIFISSLTDAYQPLEKKYELTRKILKILVPLKFSVIVQTKSCLVLRDIDILKQLKECEVGFTITTLDEKIRRIFEPFSSPVEKKLDALKSLKENGIKTYVFFGPVLPYLSDKNLEEYFETIKKLEVDEVMVDKLNLKPGIWKKLQPLLTKNFPDLSSKWHDALARKEYYEMLKEKIKKIAKKNNIKTIFCY
jgi:DNA repair photolyase